MKNIVQIYNNQPSNSSDFFYRVAQRSQEFVKHYCVKWTNIISLYEDKYEIAKNADLLIINFVADIDCLDILQYRKSKNLPTIYEINDNFLAFQENNPMFSYYNNFEVQAQIYDYISKCDALQLSSEHLYDEINLSKFATNKPIITLKNCIDAIYQEMPKEEIIIGWGGSAGHYEDIKAISQDLIKISKKYNLKISIMGSIKIKDLFNELGENLIYRPFSTLDDYHEFLSTLTIGICIVKKDHFNRTRSDVKYLEYISHGVIPVCSNFGPYENLEFALKFEDDLFSQLETVLMGDNSLLKQNIKEYANTRLTPIAIKENFDFYSQFIEIKEGVGEYIKIDKSSIFPELYNLLDKKIHIPKEDYNNPYFYYVKYSYNLEKIEFAYKSFAKNSPIIKKRLIQLMLKENKFEEAIKYLDIFLKETPECIDFIVLRLFIANNKNEKGVFNGLKLRLKKVSPLMFSAFF